MKNCHKWMILCVVAALAIIFVLPKLGVPLAGASLLVPLLMIGCCVLPMLFMMSSGQGKEGGSCCSGKEDKSQKEIQQKANTEPSKGSPTSCH